jgi:dipeptidyl aminopeptidase/acylaminoacyl peptidase
MARHVAGGRRLKAGPSVRLTRAALFGIVIGTAAAGPTLAGVPAPAPMPVPAPPGDLTLEQIMADPDWIGPPVRGAYWSADGRSVYYSTRRAGTQLDDLHRTNLADGKDAIVDGAAMATADAPAVFTPDGKRAAFVRSGDLFVVEVASHRRAQITRSAQTVVAPQFSADGGLLSFRVGDDWFVHDFNAGLTAPAAVLKTEKSPDAAPTPNDLRDKQLQIFSTLKKLNDDKEAQRRYEAEQLRRDPTRAAAPFYLGDDVKIVATSLSPNARWMLVVTTPKSFEAGRIGKLTRYVTESGYEEFEDERLRVGRNPPAPQSLVLLDLFRHETHALGLAGLPGIEDDPLATIRAENALPAPATPEKMRSVRIVHDSDDGDSGDAPPIAWSRDGTRAAIEMFSLDNKDRWIVSVDLDHFSLIPEQRLTDLGWVNWTYNDFGWLADNRTLWYQSEESGYVQLYTKAASQPARALTQGAFELSHPTLSADGRWFYAVANREAPYAYDVYRVPATGGALERVTNFRGVESFKLAEDGKQLLITHSAPYLPPQIAVLHADGTGTGRELTDTRTAAYKAIAWLTPEIVAVPSTHFAGHIYAKVYAPPPVANAPKRKAVVFVHGAGYLQDVHLRYPYYFREQMFNNLLVRHGYVVIDLDYRASQGYGRDWRTAIYRQMGHPELEDLLDGKQWLVEHESADGARFGIYGGSYGGFMTLMALFRAPGQFRAGAALRPVTDWMQYENDYTSAILNAPQVDPLAYARSSPIEFAAGLEDNLLICHGVIDDNVLFEDSMRLYERLIELHKDRFSISPYPLDRHAFANADSWLDEYKRIYRLFETEL